MQKQLFLEPRQSQYRPFFQDDFAEKAMDMSKDVPDLINPVFDLIADLRAASYASAIPANGPTAIKIFHDAMIEGGAGPKAVLDFAETILSVVSLELPEINGIPELRRKLLEKLVEVSDRTVEASRQVREIATPLDAEAVWQTYFSLSPFQLGLHAAMKQSYVSIYVAFESFVVRCTKLAHGIDSLRVSDSNFNRHLDIFGSIAQKHWHSKELQAAKEVRNAIVHNGSRITEKLKKLDIPVEAANNEVHVYPEHLRNLYSTVSTAALGFITSPALRKASA